MPAQILKLSDHADFKPYQRKVLVAGEYMSERQAKIKRYGDLKQERESWMPHWRDLADFVLPRRARFQLSGAERAKGTKKNDKIINSRATQDLRTLGSAMVAGITSPARPWFKLTTADPKLAEIESVRDWLFDVEELMREVFARSNIYNSFPVIYLDLALPGTAVLFVDDDPRDIIRTYVLPIGSFCLATDATGRVDTLYREFGMTVRQLVERFGKENVSPRVQLHVDNKKWDEWIDVLHVIEPNRMYEHGRSDASGKPWRSCYLELDGDDQVGFLAESGYEECPFMAPRWHVDGENVYGESPTMDVLGDIKALQHLEKRKATAVDKIVSPPMVGPASLKGQRASLMPADLTYEDDAGTGRGFRTAMEIRPETITVFRESIADHEARIDGALYTDLLLMFAATDRRQITAREVEERHEEKMLQLGPALERTHAELLNPLIDRVFAILLARGLIPQAPPEIEGTNLRVEYRSPLAQAQKLVAIAGIERLATMVGSMAQVNQEVKDKLDWDEIVDQYAEALGTNPNLVVPDERVVDIRARRAQQQQAMAQGQAMLAATEGARNLAQASLEDDNALARVASALGPQAAVAVGGGR